ncbi:MAG: alpha/beta fold hydrolase [Haloechinothrix sp.]
MIREVYASDGVRLAVQVEGVEGAPTVVCVHGYPDDHTVWDGVVEKLSGQFQLVTYDVRGAGESDKPMRRSAYLLDQLEADLAAVVDAVSPDRPVHLLAHDWGSIQSWHAVTGERLRGRVASFTSISGPCLDHAGQWIRKNLSRPTVDGTRAMLRQLIYSLYIAFFHLPVIPELAWRRGWLASGISLLKKWTGDQDGVRPAPSDGLYGLALYRANMLPRLSRPGERRAHLPVQVLMPISDPFVSPDLQENVDWWVPDVTLCRVPGGHWLPRTQPEVVAARTREFIGGVVSA